MTSVATEPELASTFYLDHDSTAVRDFVGGVLTEQHRTDEDRAKALFYAVRDQIFYEVYGIDVSPRGLRASTVADTGRGFCVHKCVLYAAALRAVGIPSRLMFCRVRNHLASPRLLELVGGVEFLHWTTELRLGDQWRSTTPVFNKLLCSLYGIAPLDFDETDHPFLAGASMQVVKQLGRHSDLPYEEFLRRSQLEHPGLISGPVTAAGGSLADEAPRR